MPLYDYDCAACGRRFEVLHGVHDAAPAACPLCGGSPVRKAFAPPAIHFKGSGWAKKERRATKAGGSKAAETAGSTEGDAGSGAGASAETTGGTSKDTSGASTTTAGSGTAAASSGD